jgi:hypothetical protein
MLGAAAPGSHTPWPVRVLARWFHAIYLKRYFQLRPGGRQQLTVWRPIVAAARLSENIAELEEWLLAQTRSRFPQCG